MSKTGRERTREMRKAQAEAAQKAQTRKRIIGGVGAVVILGLIAAIVTLLVRAATNDEPAASGSGQPPRNVAGSGAIPVGDASAPVTVEIYFDYMCPACGLFEKANQAELDKLVDAGEAKVELRPISFLDRYSQGTRYSTRAANALATVVDGAPEAVPAFHAGLFESQPAENSPGLTDEQIADIASEASVPQPVIDRFADGDFEAWVVKQTDASRKAGVTGTPTIKINGEVFTGDFQTPGPLTEAIRAAAAGAQ